MKLKSFLLGLVVSLLTACGVNNNISVTTANGTCPNVAESISPYCMQVNVQNNASGQNYINSSNFPITNLTVVVTGANNILSPATSKSMDPNNCGGSTISPGGACTFFLRISNESYAVANMENVQVNLNYQVNNTLFGGSDAANNYSTSFNIYQYTILYAPQTNGVLTTYSNNGSQTILIESADVVNSAAIDTSNYGILYLAGNTGIYQYGSSTNTTTTSITAGVSLNGANNLYTNGGILYTTGLAGATGVWSYSLSGESFTSTVPIYQLSNPMTTNTNALSTTGVQYLANGGQAYACQSSTAGSQCSLEANSLSSNITQLAFVPSSSESGITGLYAATSSGLYAESGITPAIYPISHWVQITFPGAIVTAMAAATTNGNNELYIGDSSGNIWILTGSSPTTVDPIVLASVPGSSIGKMVVDVVGNVLYFSAGTQIYSCSILATNCTPTSVGTMNNSSVAGLVIGSMLTNTQ